MKAQRLAPADVSYYVISLINTSKNEKFVKLWRSDCDRFCYFRENAGIFKNLDKKYFSTSLPISIKQADHLFEECEYNGHKQQLIPNNAATRSKLGLKITDKGLQHKRLKFKTDE